MPVLKTTSPAIGTSAPKERPVSTVPSSKTSLHGLVGARASSVLCVVMLPLSKQSESTGAQNLGASLTTVTP
eukprot:11806-Heterococcus_DN1.PRE.2